jgi:hypothetical protein
MGHFRRQLHFDGDGRLFVEADFLDFPFGIEEFGGFGLRLFRGDGNGRGHVLFDRGGLVGLGAGDAAQLGDHFA